MSRAAHILVAQHRFCMQAQPLEPHPQHASTAPLPLTAAVSGPPPGRPCAKDHQVSQHPIDELVSSAASGYRKQAGMPAGDPDQRDPTQRDYGQEKGQSNCFPCAALPARVVPWPPSPLQAEDAIAAPDGEFDRIKQQAFAMLQQLPLSGGSAAAQRANDASWSQLDRTARAGLDIDGLEASCSIQIAAVNPVQDSQQRVSESSGLLSEMEAEVLESGSRGHAQPVAEAMVPACSSQGADGAAVQPTCESTRPSLCGEAGGRSVRGRCSLASSSDCGTFRAVPTNPVALQSARPQTAEDSRPGSDCAMSVDIGTWQTGRQTSGSGSSCELASSEVAQTLDGHVMDCRWESKSSRTSHIEQANGIVGMVAQPCSVSRPGSCRGNMEAVWTGQTGDGINRKCTEAVGVTGNSVFRNSSSSRVVPFESRAECQV